MNTDSRGGMLYDSSQTNFSLASLLGVPLPSRRLGARLCISLLGVATVGCQPNWHADSKKYLVPYQNGNYTVAATEATHDAKAGVPMDQLLFNLDAGSIQRTAGKLPDSDASFDAADKLVGDYKQWPNTRLSEEFAAAVTTARNVNFRGSLADLVMLNCYRALNDMELGNIDSARVRLIRAQFVQQDIAAKFADALKDAKAKTEEQKKQASDSANVDQTLNSTDSSGRTVQDRVVSSDPSLEDLHPYADYVNPFCDYLQGVFFSATAFDNSDRERAVTTFRRAASMEPNNTYLREDIAAAEKVANGSAATPVTYVIFETGVSPERGQIQIPLPLFLVNNQAPTVTLYFPTIKPVGDFVQSLTVSSAGGTFETKTVCDMDSVVLQEFKNELPTIITRMIISAATKAAIDAGVKQGLKNQSPIAQIGFDVLSTGYQIAMNQADERSWRTLPKKIAAVSLATPADHVLTISPSDGSPPITVTLSDATTNVVYVKSVRRGVPIVLRQFTLSPTGNPPPPIPADITPSTMPTTLPVASPTSLPATTIDVAPATAPTAAPATTVDAPPAAPANVPATMPASVPAN